MAEVNEGVSASNSFSELSRSNPPSESGGKSPGKTRKIKKGLLFKKSTHDDSSGQTRSSGKGKKKGAKEKKPDNREPLEEVQSLAPETSVSAQAEVSDIDVEQKDLSAKKVQKLNKELVKQNTHLVKSVDALKKEKELLVGERVKLKSENKSLEKELKRVSSKERLPRKMSLPPAEEAPYDADVLKEKIQLLEDQLTEKDHIAMLLKMRIDKSHPEIIDYSELDESERAVNARTKNGSVLDSTLALEMFIEEQDISLRLRRENTELKSRISAMEAELEGYRAQRDMSPKSARKKSSGFFKRGKKSTSSLHSLKHGSEDTQQTRSEYNRSQSPDVLLKSSDSHHEQLDVSISPLFTRSNKESTISLPCYASPNQSPHLPAKNRAHSEILTLQSCLKLAIEEKTTSEESNARLEKELDGAKCKITELEASVSASEEKASEEIEQLKSSLKVAEIERDTSHNELELAQHEVDEMIKKNRSMDRMYTDSFGKKNKQIKELEKEIDEMVKKIDELDHMYTQSLGEKNKRIKDLEQEIDTFKKSKISSPPHEIETFKKSKISSPPHEIRKSTISSPPHEIETFKKSKISSPPHNVKPPVSTPPRKQSSTFVAAREKAISPPYQSKGATFRADSATSSTSDRTPITGSKHATSGQTTKERHSSSDSPKHEKVGKLYREKSQEKLVKNVPPSPTRKVGRLSRETSIDCFETPKEVNRKNSNPSIPAPSVNFATVAATRAMFEQKIGETKTDQPTSKWSSRAEKRRSVSIAEPTIASTKDKDTVRSQHSKSNSLDLQPKGSGTSTGSSDKVKLVSPAPVQEEVNEPRESSNEARNKINTHHQQQERPHSGVTPTAKKSSTSASKTSESVKISKITVSSTASPVLSNRKDISLSSPPKDLPSPSFASSPSSPSLNSSGKSVSTYSAGTTTTTTTTTTKGQIGQATKVSTITTVRHSSPSKATTVGEISPPVQKMHAVVAKSQTESKLPTPSSNRNSGMWSSSFHTPQTATTTTTNGSTTTTNRVVVKTSSRLGDNLFSQANKSGSLQNIPGEVSSGENKSPTQTENPIKTSVVNSSSSSTSSSSSSRVMRQGPTHKALLRRERKDRPKTMYAGHAETTNLVNLISKFQEAEKDKLKDVKTFAAPGVSPPAVVSPSKINGTASPGVVSPSPASSTHSFSSYAAPSVTLRQSSASRDRQATNRPTSYCGNNSSISIGKSGLSFQAPPSYSSKPLPHERILQRSRTVAVGLGSSNKLSKKAMLLKWCQFITQDYDNVNICNFAESFSNGLAFCAMIHHFLPEKIPFNTLKPADRESNFRLAFQTAEGAGIPSLLDVEDMISLPKPDWMSVMTYVSFIYNKFGQQNQQLQQQQLHSSMV